MHLYRGTKLKTGVLGREEDTTNCARGTSSMRLSRGGIETERDCPLKCSDAHLFYSSWLWHVQHRLPSWFLRRPRVRSHRPPAKGPYATARTTKTKTLQTEKAFWKRGTFSPTATVRVLVKTANFDLLHSTYKCKTRYYRLVSCSPCSIALLLGCWPHEPYISYLLHFPALYICRPLYFPKL